MSYESASTPEICLDIFFVDHCSLVCEGGHIDERVPACPPAAGDHDAAANATPAGVPDAAWLALDTVDLAEELRCPVPTLQDVPPFMRAAVRAALTTALQQLRDS